MSKTKLVFLLISTFFLNSSTLSAQIADTIKLNNPSFEDVPQPGKTPKGWYDCGFTGETPPDIQPNNAFSVSKSAADGATYVGMVTRDNDTWESIAQRLIKPMEKGKCYGLSMAICRSELYLSLSQKTQQSVNYSTPIKVRIWGGNGYCNKSQLLAESAPVSNFDWKDYYFRLVPNQNYTFIMIEAYFNQPTIFPYNGNVLIDKLSNLVGVDCQKDIVEAMKPKPPTTPTKVPPRAAKPPTKPSRVPSRVPAPTVESGIAADLANNMKSGRPIRIEQLQFAADSATIKPESYGVLNEIYKFLNNRQEVKVEVTGHTNGIPPDDFCDKLSTERARAVADYLASKGIDRNRLQYKGYGKRKPIASDSTSEGRKKNQRVEIRIISS